MAWEAVTLQLNSSAPLILHNGQTADPLNKWAKLIKQISGKKKKVDSDYEEMARLEFLAGLYMDETGPILPATVIDALVVNSAKKSRDGMTAKSGVFCLEHARLDYDGPRTADELWADERFRFSALVRVGTARISRTRPMFKNWSCVIKLHLEDTLVNTERVYEWLVTGGTQVGLCDWRPQYGRFTVSKVETLENKKVTSGNGRYIPEPA